MKIAIITETFLPSTDGVVTRLTYAIDHFLKKNHEVIILCPEVEGIKEYYKDAKIYKMPSFTFFFYKERPWGIPTTKIQDSLLEFKPDIVHCANPVSLAASGAYYAKKLNIPLICSFHTNIPKYLDHYHLYVVKPYIWDILRKFHNSAEINLVTSEAMKDLLEGHDIKNIHVLPKGVDIEKRHPKYYSDSMRYKLSDGEVDKKLLIFVGRLAPEKEIDSLKEILEIRDDIRLAIVGDGPGRKDLEKIFEGENVVFTGFLKGKELSQAFASGDGFIFPSLSESLGLVITEAMASGLPVIAAESEPTVEQIKDKENGFIYDRNSISTLEKAIDYLYDEDLIKKIKINGRKYAEKFSWEYASQDMLDSYYKTIESFNKKNQPGK